VVPLETARVLADELRALLAPACERIEVAGSIRRSKPTVGDIEPVAVPRVERRQADLFGDQVEETNLLTARCAELLAAGVLVPRPDKNGVGRWGPRYKAATYAGLAVDLFSVLPPAQWGLIYAIRTGPAAFSHQLVTPRRLGGWLPDGLHVRDGAILEADGTLVPTPEEEYVFAVLGRAYLAPAAREMTYSGR
jgi:DNA polymerase/3'-5' exonuclease PolX